MKENTIYKVKLAGIETPTGKNMRTLKLVIPEEKTIYRGVSIFLDNPKNATTSLSIWIRNLLRQKGSDETVKDAGHIEYLQEFEDKYKDKDPHKVAVDLMLKQLESLKGTEFKATYVRTVTETGQVFFNLVPYTLQTDASDSEDASSGFDAV